MTININKQQKFYSLSNDSRRFYVSSRLFVESYCIVVADILYLLWNLLFGMQNIIILLISLFENCIADLWMEKVTSTGVCCSHSIILKPRKLWSSKRRYVTMVITRSSDEGEVCVQNFWVIVRVRYLVSRIRLRIIKYMSCWHFYMEAILKNGSCFAVAIWLRNPVNCSRFLTEISLQYMLY
jgi:hypothetical protein